jgi:hypothetical protein
MTEFIALEGFRRVVDLHTNSAPHKCVIRCVKAKSVGVGVKILESTTARITKTDQDRPRLEVMRRQAITLFTAISRTELLLVQ